MALYESYLDSQHRREQHMRDEHAESDPEANVTTDAETDADPDEATPHDNGDWYPDWNPLENEPVLSVPAKLWPKRHDDREPPQDVLAVDADPGPNYRDDYTPSDERREQLRREFAAKRTTPQPEQPPRGVPNPPTDRPNYTGD